MQRQRRGKPVLFWMALEADLQLNGIGWEVFEMRFELGELLLKFLLKLPVRPHVLCNQIPFYNHMYLRFVRRPESVSSSSLRPLAIADHYVMGPSRPPFPALAPNAQ